MTKTKKNWMLRISVIALIFTLVSTSLLAGTLAKYTSEFSGSDTARVAKWNIGATNTINNLFDYVDSGVLGYPGNAVGADGVKLIAPGTKGSASFALTGAPEVAYKLEFAVSGVFKIDDVEAAWPGDYYPIQFSLNNSDWYSLSGFGTAFSALNDEFAPGTAPSGTFTIYWKWDFGTGSTDAQDTVLGKAAVTNKLGVTLSVTVTAVQLDTYTP